MPAVRLGKTGATDCRTIPRKLALDAVPPLDARALTVAGRSRAGGWQRKFRKAGAGACRSDGWIADGRAYARDCVAVTQATFANTSAGNFTEMERPRFCGSYTPDGEIARDWRWYFASPSAAPSEQIGRAAPTISIVRDSRDA